MANRIKTKKMLVITIMRGLIIVMSLLYETSYGASENAT